MPSPFPGMDPYLESPAIWPGVHVQLAVALAHRLVSALRPRYAVCVERRLYFPDLASMPGERVAATGRPRPDITIAHEAQPAYAPGQPVAVRLPMADPEREPTLEVRDAASGRVVTVVEFLSPANKLPGSEARRAYLHKRMALLETAVHLVEIDLLRAGEPMPTHPPRLRGTYGVLVSRAPSRPEAELYVFSVRDRIPMFPLPLLAPDADFPVDLRAALDEVYDRGGYDYQLRSAYAAAPEPPLAPEDARWAAELLAPLAQARRYEGVDRWRSSEPTGTVEHPPAADSCGTGP